jgi:hypothetical protein
MRRHDTRYEGATASEKTAQKPGNGGNPKSQRFDLSRNLRVHVKHVNRLFPKCFHIRSRVLSSRHVDKKRKESNGLPAAFR